VKIKVSLVKLENFYLKFTCGLGVMNRPGEIHAKCGWTVAFNLKSDILHFCTCCVHCYQSSCYSKIKSDDGIRHLTTECKIVLQAVNFC